MALHQLDDYNYLPICVQDKESYNHTGSELFFFYTQSRCFIAFT
jgi:hypothetical protein